MKADIHFSSLDNHFSKHDVDNEPCGYFWVQYMSVILPIKCY